MKVFKYLIKEHQNWALLIVMLYCNGSGHTEDGKQFILFSVKWNILPENYIIIKINEKYYSTKHP